MTEDQTVRITDHGQISSMELPAGWVEGAVQVGEFDLRSVRAFHPADSNNARICLFYRGRPASQAAAEAFRAALRAGEHQVSDGELANLEEIVNGAVQSDRFALDSARVVDWNGRAILAIAGRWLEEDRQMLSLFVDADGSGRIVQEIYYTAASAHYDRFLPAAEAALHSIEWLPTPEPADFSHDGDDLVLLLQPGGVHGIQYEEDGRHEPGVSPPGAIDLSGMFSPDVSSSTQAAGEDAAGAASRPQIKVEVHCRLGLEGKAVQPGTQLDIRWRWEEYGCFALSLALPGSPRVQDFSLTGFIRHEGTNWAFLRYPPDVSMDEPTRLYFAFAVKDHDRLETISPAQLDKIVAPFLRALQTGTALDAQAVAATLGPFPTWAEIADAYLQSGRQS